MERGTVIIHATYAGDDIMVDTGWETVNVFVALNHETFTLIDADVSRDLLEKRLKRDGWDVRHELAEFTHNGDRWVRNA